MALVYDNTRSAKQGGGWMEHPDPQAFYTTELPALQKAAADRLARSQGRWGLADKVAMGAAVTGLGAGALSAFGPAAGAASHAMSVPSFATEGVGFSSAPLAGASFASKVPWLGVGSKAADTLFGIYANRKQSQANQAALRYQQQKDAEALAFDREQEAERRREWTAQQAQAQKAWEADQTFQKAKWDADQEERAYQRRLLDEREARRAPYRAASLAALQGLPDLIASGMQSPGLGSLGSYRRG